MDKACPSKKHCTECKKPLDISLFGVDRRRKDGHHSKCKACLKSKMSSETKTRNLQRAKARYAKFKSIDPNFHNRYQNELRSKWTEEQWQKHYSDSKEYYIRNKQWIAMYNALRYYTRKLGDI